MRVTGTALVIVGLLAVPDASRAAPDLAGQAAVAPRAADAGAGDHGGGSSREESDPQAAATASAPANPNSLRTLLRDLGGDFVHVPSKESALIASIGAGLALAAHPADGDVNGKLAHDGGFFRVGAVTGNTITLMGASAAAYGIGRAFGLDRTAHLGLDLLRAQILTEAMVQSLKVSVQRRRPNGGSGYSFPSGHAAVSFATAAVLDRHHSWRVAVPGYAFATYVAASRLHDNVHNLSDVVFGAAVGIIAGRTVTRHVAGRFEIVPTPTPGGVAVMFVRRPTGS